MMTFQYDPQRPNIDEIKMRRHFKVECWVGLDATVKVSRKL